jgi:hypothetical protein
MPRLADTLLTGQAQSYGRQTPMVDPKYGGQNGYATNLTQLVSASRYRPQQLRVVLLDAPKAFERMPNGEFYINTLKALLELHMEKWDGFQSTLEVNPSEVAIGGAGEMLQTPNNVTRTRTQPTSEVTDLYGRPFQNFLQDWIYYLIGDPDTKTPMINTISNVRVTDMLLDQYSATILAYMPDPTNTKVDKAWLCTNVFPLGAGDDTGGRDLTSPRDSGTLSISWSAATQVGRGVEALAQAYMNSLQLTNANPMMRKAAIEGINANVAALTQGGFASDLSNLGASAVIAS